MNKKQNKHSFLLVTLLNSVFTNEKVMSDAKQVVFCTGFISRDLETFFKSPTEASEERVMIQSIIDFALQLVSTRLVTLFFKDQKENRDEIERLVRVNNESVLKKRINSVLAESLESLLSRAGVISQEITSLKELFSQIIDITRILGFRVFDEEVYRYDWYVVLNVGNQYGQYFRFE